MKIFKFGGASVKDSESVKQVADIIKNYENQKLIIVVSAMGKTTNALEKVVNEIFNNTLNRSEQIIDQINKIKKYHIDILNDLFNAPNHLIYSRVDNYFRELFRISLASENEDYDYVYDSIVPFGELISTEIISHYLNFIGLKNKWVDIRNYIKTDSTYRDGKVNWRSSQSLLKKICNENLTVTQGFIAGTKDKTTTTLGREGSDYSAAIIAHCIDAEEVIIWKDVPGVLNADPKFYNNTVKLNKINYQEAIELAYYGATIIHPKTIKPLQNKKIPLRVKSFFKPDDDGTIISDFENLEFTTPCYIFKTDQVLISISPLDLSFIAEDNLSLIFDIFAKAKVKINLMQNSAVSFSVCVDNNKIKLSKVLGLLNNNFKTKYNENLTLITIRHYDQKTIEEVTKDKSILLEQKSRSTVQLIVK
ncbi:MAG: aspartate kinase [Bacteroidota bacterium]|nr:aspartate kinase [Bacteroidota bacterium]